MVFTCCVPDCENTNNAWKMHRFPNPKKYLAVFSVWIKAIGNENLSAKVSEDVYNNYRVCDRHFDVKCRIPNPNPQQRGLSVCAIPTLYLRQELNFSGDESCLGTSSRNSLASEEMLVKTDVSSVEAVSPTVLPSREHDNTTLKRTLDVAGLRTPISRRGAPLPESASDTADFLLLINNIFDSVNGSRIYPVQGNELRCAVKQHSKHVECWYEYLKVLETVIFVTSKRRYVPPSLTNLIYTLKSFISIWKKLKSEGYKFLVTRNINQDPLENFFGCIRSHGGRNVNPTCNSFGNSYKSLILNNFFSAHSMGANCENDSSDGILNNMKNILNKHLLSMDEPISESEEEEDEAQALTSPTSTFVQLFSTCSKILNFYVPKLCLSKKLSETLKRKLKPHLQDHFKSCSEHDLKTMFINMFVTFYINTWTKNVNKILRGLDSRNTVSNDLVKQYAQKRYIKFKTKTNALRKMKGLI